MKFLHLGDLHLGKVVNGFPLLNDQRETLEALLEDAVERGVDALVLAGDLYDSGQPPAAAVRTLSRFLVEAVGRGLEVFAIPGNHDSADRVGYLSPLLEDQGVHVAPVFDGHLASVEVEDGEGPVTFWLMPYLRPVDVQRAGGLEEGEIARTYTEALSAVIEGASIDGSQRNVLLAHQFVTSAGEDPERSESELFVGTLGNVDAAIFDGFDYVALGHLHRPQSVGRPEVRYAGSLLKYSRSEARGQKSAPLVTLGPKGSVEVELLPLRPPHDLRELRGSLEELVADDYPERGDAGDYLHVTLTDDAVPSDAMARLRQAYPRVMSLEVDNASTQRLSQVEAIEFDEEAFDPLELFETFYEEQNGVELTPEQRAIVTESLERTVGSESIVASEAADGGRS